MKDVMLDFETFGNGKNACIVQVGAIFFDRRTSELGNSYKANIDARSSVKSGAEIDADTIYWWLSQSRQAIDSITLAPLQDIHDVMIRLNNFLASAECIWSHATFDFVILAETMKRLGIKPAFSYRAARDIRTLMDLAGLSTSTFAREGTHHDALDDCKFQVLYCVEALRKVEGRGV